ncbi:MAG: AMP-binding protein, partial [bacterium]|nr:AMP-binding protein [bacterium]
MDKKKYSDKLAVVANQNKKERDYWFHQLAGDPEKTCFPYDYRLSGAESAQAPDSFIERYTSRFPGEIFAKAMQLSGRGDLKLHMILVTALMILLETYTRRGDVIVGSPILKQQTQIEFVNTFLPFRNRVEKQKTFKQLLLEVRQSIVNASENQNYPMVVLYDRLNLTVNGSECPLSDVVLLLENFHDAGYIEDIDRNMTFSFKRAEQYLECVVEYHSRLYRESTVQRIVRHFTAVLDAVLSDVNVVLKDIEMLSEAEKEEIVVGFNRTAFKEGFEEADFPRTLHQAFERQVAASRDAVSVVHDHFFITYGELNRRANILARVLRQKGVVPDTIVALRVAPSVEMMVGELGILKAGGAYLPLPLDAPAERIRFMLEDSSAKNLVISGESPVKELIRDIEVIDLNEALFTPPTPLTPPAYLTQSTHLSYVIYTSGTTGQPKGVLVEHRNVVSYLRAFYNEFEIRS